MHVVRGNKRKKGGSPEAIIRQKIEQMSASRGMPWTRLPDRSKGSAPDEWAWEKFQENGEFPDEFERRVAVDNRSVSNFVENREHAMYTKGRIVLVNAEGEDVHIEPGPPQENKPSPGDVFRQEQKEWEEQMAASRKKTLDKFDHMEAVETIIAAGLPATPEEYQRQRDLITNRRELAKIFKEAKNG